MECNKVNLDNFSTRPELAPIDDEDERYIYKVDVGSMRGFDLNETQMPTGDLNVKLELGHRTPQVLEIIGRDTIEEQDVIRILRSTTLNTRIHQPRPAWEECLNRTSNRLKIPQSHERKNTYTSYANKYLKYKNKYLELKKI
jgi:hypothetical protein